jgi:hypothetical protein
MSIAAVPIYKALEQLLKGEIGITGHKVATTTVAIGHTPWWGDILINTQADIYISEGVPHPQTPPQSMASHRLELVSVELNLYHDLQSNVQEDQRRATRAGVLADTDEIYQALHYPNSLKTTLTGTATNIISGMLENLSYTLIEEDWEDNVLSTQITGTATVRVTQP